MDGWLVSMDSLQTASQVRPAVTLSAGEAFFNLGTFAFVELHLFSTRGRRQTEAVKELLCIIERLEELHTKVQGDITSPYISTTFLVDVSRRWYLYPNLCMNASSSEDV